MVDDPSVLGDLRDFAEGRTLLLPPRLDLVINLDVEKVYHGDFVCFFQIIVTDGFKMTVKYHIIFL